MQTAHSEEIEFLRKNIETLSLPLSENNSIINKNSKISKNKNKYKNNILLEEKNDEDEKKNHINEIEKNFDEIYQLYNNDKKYKLELEEKERNKLLKSTHLNSIQLNGKNYLKEKIIPPKLDVNESYKIIEKNNHQGRHETNYEDDFSSSDSYESEFFTIKRKIPKHFKLRKKEDLIENKDNIIEIVRVLKLSK